MNSRTITSRTSSGFRFRAVRGVFPRSFPGVLNISVILLGSISIIYVLQQKTLHVVLVEDVGHMLIEKVQLISDREGKVVRFLGRELRDLLVLLV